ncbi:MAG: C45 family autoproteolytic acyltransferase/hydrolase [Acidobacteria bacterium]|nr:C45 family autoproteolytic acyltransferase/hydrolase [Acidobacteriota bacterium]
MNAISGSARLLLGICALNLLASGAAAQVPAPPPPAGIPILTFTGTWRQIGEQQGRAGYYRIREFAAAMTRLFSEQDAVTYYERLVREGMIPDDVKEQIAGIAAGLAAKDTSDDIDETKAFRMALQINLMMAVVVSKQPQCTAVAFTSPAGTYLAHNTDGGLPAREWDEIHVFRPTDGGHAFVSINFAGAVGGVLAQNDQGLALTFNVGKPNPNPAPGTNYLLALREVIATCSTVREAIKYLQDFVAGGHYFMASGANVILLDHKNGDMARVQLTSRGVRVSYGKPLAAGVTSVFATNHWDDVDERFPAPDAANPQFTSSVRRYSRLTQILPSLKEFNAATGWRILTDTTASDGRQGPNDDTICRKGPSAGTVDAIVFGKNFITFSPGPPCEYVQEYGLPQIMKAPSAQDNDAYASDVARFLADWKRVGPLAPRQPAVR